MAARFPWSTEGRVRLKADDSFSLRLKKIYDRMSEVIDRYCPEQAAVEALIFAKNASSAFKLGQARGAAILSAANAGLEVFEYAPLEIKKNVTGYGRAEKQQVRHMVRIMLNKKDIQDDNISDALAVAICHLTTSRSPLRSNPKDFRESLHDRNLERNTDPQIPGSYDYRRQWHRLPGPRSLEHLLRAAGNGLPGEASIFILMCAKTSFICTVSEPCRKRRCSSGSSRYPGVGPKLALNILSGIDAAELRNAIWVGRHDPAQPYQGGGQENRATHRRGAEGQAQKGRSRS